MWSGWWWQKTSTGLINHKINRQATTRSTLQLATEKGLWFMLPLPMPSFQPGLQPGVRRSGEDASAGKQRTPRRNGNKPSWWARRLCLLMAVTNTNQVPVITESRLCLTPRMFSRIKASDAHTNVLTFSSFSALRFVFSKLRQRTTLRLHKSWLQQNGKRQQNLQPSVLTKIHKHIWKKA